MATVPNIENTDRILDATAAGGQTEFIIPWPVIGANEAEVLDDLLVYVDDSQFAAPDIVFVGNPISGISGIWNGGTLQFLTPLTNGQRVIIASARAPHRTGNFLEGKSLPFTTLDTLQNDIVVQLRDLQLLAKRCLNISLKDFLDGVTTEDVMGQVKANMDSAAASAASAHTDAGSASAAAAGVLVAKGYYGPVDDIASAVTGAEANGASYLASPSAVSPLIPNNIMVKQAGTWFAAPPILGLPVWVRAKNAEYTYTSNGWLAETGPYSLTKFGIKADGTDVTAAIISFLDALPSTTVASYRIPPQMYADESAFQSHIPAQVTIYLQSGLSAQNSAGYKTAAQVTVTNRTQLKDSFTGTVDGHQPAHRLINTQNSGSDSGNAGFSSYLWSIGYFNAAGIGNTFPRDLAYWQWGSPGGSVWEYSMYFCLPWSGRASQLWAAGRSFGAGAYCTNAGKNYSTTAGGICGATPPTHSSGTVSDGAVSWTYRNAVTKLYSFDEAGNFTNVVGNTYLGKSIDAQSVTYFGGFGPITTNPTRLGDYGMAKWRASSRNTGSARWIMATNAFQGYKFVIAHSQDATTEPQLDGDAGALSSGAVADLVLDPLTGFWGMKGVTSPRAALDIGGSVCVKSYAKSALPSASAEGQMIYVSDDVGGATIAFSDGSNWRRVADRAVIS